MLPFCLVYDLILLQTAMKISRFTKLLLKFWPNVVLKKMARKMGIKNPLFENAHQLFSKVGRIDFFPLSSSSRGFMIILDKKTALYFYQDGDHFIYDGYEIGEYDKGNVTIFDSLK
ncbi:MAG: hypothetical protein Q8O32_00360 [bacterium]|nr:hypothetical protein [bacterium]